MRCEKDTKTLKNTWIFTFEEINAVCCVHCISVRNADSLHHFPNLTVMLKKTTSPSLSTVSSAKPAEPRGRAAALSGASLKRSSRLRGRAASSVATAARADLARRTRRSGSSVTAVDLGTEWGLGTVCRDVFLHRPGPRIPPAAAAGWRPEQVTEVIRESAWNIWKPLRSLIAVRCCLESTQICQRCLVSA